MRTALADAVSVASLMTTTEAKSVGSPKGQSIVNLMRLQAIIAEEVEEKAAGERPLSPYQQAR